MQKENKIKKFVFKTFFILGIFFLFSSSASAFDIPAFLIGATQAVTTGATTYFGYPACGNATEATCSYITPALTIQKICITAITAQPASGALNIYLRKNTSDVSSAITLPASSIVGTVVCSADNLGIAYDGTSERFGYKLVNSATATSSGIRIYTYYTNSVSDPAGDTVVNGISPELEWFIEFMGLYLLFVSILLLVFWLGKKLI